MEVEFNFSAMAAVVSPNETDLLVTAHFRAYNDYVGLSFNSEDYRNHEKARYIQQVNYDKTSLSFVPIYNGPVTRFNDVEVLPSLVVNYTNGDKKVSTLGYHGVKHDNSEYLPDFRGKRNLQKQWIKWGSEVITWEDVVVVGYEDVFDDEGNYLYTREITENISGGGVINVDYVLDYTYGIIYPVGGGGIPAGANITISYKYNTHEKYIINFSDLYQGTHPADAVKVSPFGIGKITFPIIPEYYTEGRDESVGRSDLVTVLFKEWTVNQTYTLPPLEPTHPFRIAEGYDDEYYRNPYRLVESMHILGYRGPFNLYIGASHYYDKIANAGAVASDYKAYYLVRHKGACEAALSWFRHLCKALKHFEFSDIIVSISMENLQMPEEWKQRMWDGTPGQTGWYPPTSFFSPVNDDVRLYWKKIAKQYLDIVVSEGMTPILQLGEPWWWWQEFMPGDVNTPYPGRPPCFYDQATKELYASEMGGLLPVFKDSNIIVNDSVLDTLSWLRDKLGSFSDFAKDIVKEYTDGVYTVLFFPPSVLDSLRVPESMRIANYPVANWKSPALDFIQIEDYDWIVHDNPNHPNVFDFARTGGLEYQPHITQYFSGFAWNQFGIPLDVQWGRIEKAAVKGLSIGSKDVFIWAGTQVRRDSWSPKMPIVYIPHVINRNSANYVKR